jgi:hypothetical protein
MRIVEELIEQGRQTVAASLKEAFEAGDAAMASEAQRKMADLADEFRPAAAALGANAGDETAKIGRAGEPGRGRREGQSYCDAGDATRGLFIAPLGLLAFLALAAIAIWRWTLL